MKNTLPKLESCFLVYHASLVAKIFFLNIFDLELGGVYIHLSI